MRDRLEQQAKLKADIDRRNNANNDVRKVRRQSKVPDGTPRGRCDFRACGSACCKRFKLFYPKGTFKEPLEPSQQTFEYPKSVWLDLMKRSNSELLLLLHWRGMTITNIGAPKDMMIVKCPTPQKWYTYKTKENTVLVLPDLQCKYLTPMGACRIQKRKPQICKDFPRNIEELPPDCTYTVTTTNDTTNAG